MKEIKYTELLDYILALLKMIRKSNPDDYVSLTSILKMFQRKMSFNELVEIGKYFDARGWARAVFILGDVKLQILTAGLVHLEENGPMFDADFTSFLSSLSEGRDSNMFVEITKGEEDPKNKILSLIDELVKKIRDKEGAGVDIIKDLEIIKFELTKLYPDFKLIEIKLDRLSNIPYILTEIQRLKDYLTASASV
jgi:hypothetical protein